MFFLSGFLYARGIEIKFDSYWGYNMGIRFSQRDIARLLRHTRVEPQKKGSNLYAGFGPDGQWRTCKFDYHKGREEVLKGTAVSIAKSLLFADVKEMKRYIEKNL